MLIEDAQTEWQIFSTADALFLLKLHEDVLKTKTFSLYLQWIDKIHFN